MSIATITIPITNYPHDYALIPFVERRVTCYKFGGAGNTLLETCLACEQHRGFGRDEGKGWDHILCRVEIKPEKTNKDRGNRKIEREEKP